MRLKTVSQNNSSSLGIKTSTFLFTMKLPSIYIILNNLKCYCFCVNNKYYYYQSIYACTMCLNLK